LRRQMISLARFNDAEAVMAERVGGDAEEELSAAPNERP
jgi:hypothetical protein